MLSGVRLRRSVENGGLLGELPLDRQCRVQGQTASPQPSLFSELWGALQGPVLAGNGQLPTVPVLRVLPSLFGNDENLLRGRRAPRQINVQFGGDAGSVALLFDVKDT